MSKLTTIKEQVLLLKIRHGDAAAYAEIYDTFVSAIFRYINFRVANEEIAQDLTSDTFLKVWERLTSDTEIKVRNIRAYLYQVARNLIADHYRQQQPLLLEDLAEELDNNSETTEVHLERQATLAEIEQALKKLKPLYQEVIILIYIEGLSIKEAAAILDKTSGATRVLLHRALNQLKSLLK